jgi:hypothetical protein
LDVVGIGTTFVDAEEDGVFELEGPLLKEFAVLDDLAVNDSPELRTIVRGLVETCGAKKPKTVRTAVVKMKRVRNCILKD